ncbi:MAG TPA: hypothetical protein VFV38_44985 [Ktedonobacteraceae bacterium]|nr:hypothetical protein [Ktedonobacteraceae bacterium]
MTRKDSEKDAERPHYYSQFWLDIAAGRRVIGGPKPEETEVSEVETPEVATTRRAGRNSAADGYKEVRAAAVVEPIVEEEDADEGGRTELEEDFEQGDLVEEDELPNIVLDEVETETDEPLEDEYPEDEEDDLFEEEEEEEEDEDWGRRGGRKKAKPSRPVKPVKKTKPRRTF